MPHRTTEKRRANPNIGLALVFILMGTLALPTPGNAQIMDDWGEVDALPQLWFNRVDGLHAGLELWVPLALATELTVDAGYKTALGEASYGARLENKWFDTMLGASYRRDVEPQYRSRFVTRTLNGVYTILGGDDYFDYYRRDGGTIYMELFAVDPTIRPRLTWRYERHNSLERQTSYDLFGRKQQPLNPSVADGTLSSVEASLRWEPFTSRDDIFQIRRIEVQGEHGADWLGGDFNYTRLASTIDTRLNFTTDRRSPYFRSRLHGSIGFNELPHQRLGIVETVPAPFSIFGGMRTGPPRPHQGQQVGATYWELNLRGRPLTAIGLGFLGSRWDIYVHGGHGFARVTDEWMEQMGDRAGFPRVTGGGFDELGIGIGRILRVIKLEGTWRLDQPDFAFRFTLTNPF